jgi:hypothetical protein
MSGGVARQGMTFELWLESDYWVPSDQDDPFDEFFNMQIRLATGETYALNVWTFQYFARACRDIQMTGENLQGAYLLPPDLFVERLDRKLLEEVVADLIRRGGLRHEWRVSE